MQDQQVNRWGKCLNEDCDCDWDGFDILEAVRRLGVLYGKPDVELVNLAARGYGYDINKPSRFSKVIAISIVNDRESEFSMDEAPTPVDFYMCPHCRKVYNVETGEEYKNLDIAKKTKLGLYEPDYSELPDESKE